MVIAEFKAEKGRTTFEQAKWLGVFMTLADRAAPYVEVHLWRPSDWPEIEEILR